MSSVEPPRTGGTAARRAARGTPVGPARTTRPDGRDGAGLHDGTPDDGADEVQPPLVDRAARSGPKPRRELDPDTLAALEEERDFLLGSLDDLEREHDVGDVDDPDYSELKDDYTARAAAVLRAIDDRRDLARASASSGRSWVRTFAVLGVVAVLAMGVGWFVFHSSGDRAPGSGITGDPRQDSANDVLQAQALTGQANVALQDGDSNKAISLFTEALKAYSDALDISPGNVEALAYRGWLYHNLAVGAGEGTQADEFDGYARDDLDAALAADATYPDARVFRALLHTDAGEFADAQVLLDGVQDSDVPPYMTDELTNLRRQVATGLAGAS